MTLQTYETRSNACSRCEALPRPGNTWDYLYLWPPLGHSSTKLVRALRCVNWKHRIEEGIIIVRLDGNLGDLLSLVDRVFSGLESADTRCLLKDSTEELSTSHIPQARSLSQLRAISEADWLLEMLAEDRLTSHFQPIVRADDPTEVFGYEGLLRGIDLEGDLVPPFEIFQAAKRADLLFQTDLAARRTAISEALSHRIETNLFVNFTPTSIYDPEYCLRSTVKVIDRAGVDHERVVFEVTETEDLNDTRHLLNIVEYYKQGGFRVALDDVGSGYSSINLLHQLQPDFIKLDMQLIRGVTTNSYKATVSEKLLEMAFELGAETVVEGVETIEELEWAREHGATYIQGYLISRPASPPPQLN